jgi:hypothetical protein
LEVDNHGKDVAIVALETDPITPTTIHSMKGALPGGYALRSPIPVTVWDEGADVVADAPELDLHAFGGDADAAVANLGVRIVEHFERLEELGDRMAPRMRRERERLRDLLITPGA